MKPEIKALLPELPPEHFEGYYTKSAIEAWRDKLIEGAEQKVGFLDDDGFVVCGPGSVASTHTALLICPREIKKQTPPEILKSAIEKSLSVNAQSYREALRVKDRILREALAKIEAAT